MDYTQAVVFYSDGGTDASERSEKLEIPPFKVQAFVHDTELQDCLNSSAKDGYYPKEMFRNTAGADGQETTTVVFEHYDVC